MMVVLAFMTAFFYAKPKVETEIKTTLKNFGFNHAEIENSSIHLTAIFIPQIKLDKDGFSVAKNINVSLSWPRFISTGHIKKIEIAEVKLASTLQNLKFLPSKLKKLNWNAIQTVKSDEIKINNLIWDLATKEKALRFQASGAITKSKDNDDHILKATIDAEQYDIGFNSQWSGVINAKAQIIDGEISALKFNHKSFNLNRGTGWLSYQSKDGETDLSAQIESGSGKLMGAPITNISLLGGQDTQGYPILFRAKAAGIEGTYITSDLHYAPKSEDRKFTTTLDIQNLNDFQLYLNKNNIVTKVTASDLANITDTKTYFTYMPDRRFPDGPLPFDLYTDENDKTVLEGTFLVYPDSYDVRGTLEADDKVTRAIKGFFNIDSSQISGNVIRLDSNIGQVLQ